MTNRKIQDIILNSNNEYGLKMVQEYRDYLSNDNEMKITDLDLNWDKTSDSVKDLLKDIKIAKVELGGSFKWPNKYDEPFVDGETLPPLTNFQTSFESMEFHTIKDSNSILRIIKNNKTKRFECALLPKSLEIQPNQNISSPDWVYVDSHKAIEKMQEYSKKRLYMINKSKSYKR